MTTFLIFLFLRVALLQIIVIQNLSEYSDSQKHVCAEARPKTHTTYIHKEKNTASAPRTQGETGNRPPDPAPGKPRKHRVARQPTSSHPRSHLARTHQTPEPTQRNHPRMHPRTRGTPRPPPGRHLHRRAGAGKSGAGNQTGAQAGTESRAYVNYEGDYVIAGVHTEMLNAFLDGNQFTLGTLADTGPASRDDSTPPAPSSTCPTSRMHTPRS